MKRMCSLALVLMAALLPMQVAAATGSHAKRPVAAREELCDQQCSTYVDGALQAQTERMTYAVIHNYIETVQRHFAPFLVCTRGHESDTSGGYSAVNPTGSYLGAYQFSRSTWHSTREHFGLYLIPDDPLAADMAGQDLMAWRLMEWQGSAPWLYRCSDVVGVLG